MGRRNGRKTKTERKIQSCSAEEEILGVIEASEIRDYLYTKNLNLLATVSQRILALLFRKYK